MLNRSEKFFQESRQGISYNRVQLSLFFIMIIIILVCHGTSYASSWYWPFPASSGLNRNFAGHGYTGVDVAVPANSDIYAPTDGEIKYVFTGCNHGSGLVLNDDGSVNESRTVRCQNAGKCSPNNGYVTDSSDLTYRFCNNGFGNGVVIYTDDGYTVQFAHMNSVANNLYVGMRVTKDTYLGVTGDKGCSTGVHCHYAVSSGTEYWTHFVDPMSITYLSRTPAEGSEMTSGYDRVFPDGDYIIHNAAYTGKPQVFYLDFEGAASPAANLTNAVVTGAVNINSIPSVDVWTLEYLNNGFYKITQKGTNMGLNVLDVSLSSGASIIANPYDGEKNEQWAINYNWSNGFSIQARHSSFYLDAGSMTNGSQIRQATGNGTGTQSWLFVPYKPSQSVENGRYVLVSEVGQNLQLDVPGESGDIADGTEVSIWQINGSSRFNAFDFTKLSNGYYSVIHHASGKALEIYGGASTITRNLSLYTANGSAPQNWAVIANGTGTYSLVSQYSGLAIDLANAATANGSPIRTYPRNGSPAQTWHLVPAEYTVSYDANGGAGTPGNQIKYFQEDLTLSSTIPAKDGFIFIGWGLSADSGRPAYQPGGTFDLEADTILYALWRTQPTEYILTVDALLDQISADSTEGYGTFDVYIDGELEAEEVTSFIKSYPRSVQYEIANIQVVPGKRFDGACEGYLSGEIPYGAETVTLAFTSVIDVGADWNEVDDIPEDLDLSRCEVEYQNHYTTTGRTSPGGDWTLYQEGVIQYETTGNSYESDDPLPTSETRRLVGHYYYHWCDGNLAVSQHTSSSQSRHFIPMNQIGTDYSVAVGGTDGIGRTYYFLTHLTGPNAGWTAQCGDPGCIGYYEGNVYQDYQAYQINTYIRHSEWTAEPDPEASFVTCRVRLKDAATPVINEISVTAVSPRDYTVVCSVSDNMGIAKIRFLTWTDNESEMDAVVQVVSAVDAPTEAAISASIAVADHENATDLYYHTKAIVYDTYGNVTNAEDCVSVYMPTLTYSTAKLILPADLLEIEEEAFDGASDIGEVVLPEGTLRIGSKAFANCNGLILIHMPDSITEIATDAFIHSDHVVFLCASNNAAATFARANDIPYFTGE